MFVAEGDEPHVSVSRRDRCAGEPGRPNERLRAREHRVLEVADVGGHDELLPVLFEVAQAFEIRSAASERDL